MDISPSMDAPDAPTSPVIPREVERRSEEDEDLYNAVQVITSNRFKVIAALEEPSQAGENCQGALHKARDEISTALPEESLAVILLHLREEIKGKFEVSEDNQTGIQAACSALSQKLNKVAA
ncbi:hypothetical protein NDU88_008148 [Pleurodeles waltl]|uniref:Uncharacterized protein n=1 Tax=Pleurodeles waltl TaxID=8319 RepID=A0AAV7VUM8_PLEWA|nr:hypothetical protein NDU88_008148 [Pleurodeles waltl]